MKEKTFMKLKLFYIFILFFASANVLLADAKIAFTKTTHDFGTIQEKDGDVTVKFEYTNAGDTPLLVTRANASCGCTSPEYSKKPLRPGETGEITVTYHAKGRPGAFDKSIYVYSNDPKHEKTLLTITGNVISSTGIRESYSEELGGGLRLKTKSLNFFDVYPTRANRTRTLAVYNEGSTPMRLAFRNVPKHIAIESNPEVVQPKAEGIVHITYLTDKANDWGSRNDVIDIYVKGQETHMKDNHLLIMADIWEDFSGLTRQQRQQAPEIEVSNSIIDFEKCSHAVTREITISNNGQEKLTIRKIQNEDFEVFHTTLDKTTLKPGESTKLHITYDPAKSARRSITQHLTIISNDPSNSRVIVNLQASK